MPSLLLAILASFPSLPRFRPRRVRSGGEDGSSAEDSNGLNHRGSLFHHEDAPSALPKPRALGWPWTCQPISRTPPPPGLHSARFAAIGGDPRPLEPDLQRGVEREPKGLVWCLTHRVCTSAASSSRPNPHQ